MDSVIAGNASWMLMSAALVLLMTPALALFYGGMTERRGVLNMMLMSFGSLAVVSIIYVLWGWSMSYGTESWGGIVANPFEFFGLKDSIFDANGEYLEGAEGYANIIDIGFQLTFAVISTAIISGALAGRVKFGTWMVFSGLWATFVYFPLAHMVWGGGILGEGESSVTSWIFGSEGGEALVAPIDFAGGTVVHINAASAGLIGAYLLGKRAGFGKEAFKPHNLPMVFTGASILYIGWFGFNAGSASAANGVAALAFLNTVVATAGAILSWTFAEWIVRGKPSLLGACSGMIAGLVAITPAAGTVGVGGALIIGLVGGIAGLWGVVTLKNWLKVDDTCDVFGVHGVCGIVGCLLTGVFTSASLGGTGYAEGVTMGHQVWIQLLSVVITLVWSGVAAFIAFKVAGAIVGLRVPEEQEREGLDVNSHGESAYNQ